MTKEFSPIVTICRHPFKRKPLRKSQCVYRFTGWTRKASHCNRSPSFNGSPPTGGCDWSACCQHIREYKLLFFFFYISLLTRRSTDYNLEYREKTQTIKIFSQSVLFSSRRQQPKQGKLDLPLPGYVVQNFRGDPQAFPGLAPWPPTNGRALHASSGASEILQEVLVIWIRHLRIPSIKYIFNWSPPWRDNNSYLIVTWTTFSPSRW